MKSSRRGRDVTKPKHPAGENSHDHPNNIPKYRRTETKNEKKKKKRIKNSSLFSNHSKNPSSNSTFHPCFINMASIARPSFPFPPLLCYLTSVTILSSAFIIIIILLSLAHSLLSFFQHRSTYLFAIRIAS